MKLIIAMPEMGSSLFRKYMKSKYVESLARFGAKVEWISCEKPCEELSKLLSCDGLLLPGGADIDPALYSKEREKECGKPNELRDTAEMLYLKAFLETEKPILGICRGAQLINTYFGGTLFQDIKNTQKKKHMDFFSRSKSTHMVKIEENSKLFKIFEKEEILVNSMHHQAIDEVGKGLSITAVSEDGFIEGIEKNDHPFLLGVQWHPEHMSKKDPEERKLFEVFLSKCR